ncbi:MAG: DUF1566 domain-containing protein [Nitrospirae bacterium]|nr:DUF1566 domain-containing protein [Nitrospirota bacterium]
MPGIEEFSRLVEDIKGIPHIWLKLQGFNNVQSSYYWSSTSFAYSTSGAWVIGIGVGYIAPAISPAATTFGRFVLYVDSLTICLSVLYGIYLSKFF